MNASERWRFDDPAPSVGGRCPSSRQSIDQQMLGPADVPSIALDDAKQIWDGFALCGKHLTRPNVRKLGQSYVPSIALDDAKQNWDGFALCPSLPLLLRPVPSPRSSSSSSLMGVIALARALSPFDRRWVGELLARE